MRPEPGFPSEFSPNEPETDRTNPDHLASDQGQAARPFRGGYYWFPAPSPDGITWSVVTCRDLGCGADAGHDADLWPRLMLPLAAAWGKEARILKKKLALSYTGLPRGRVTRPETVFLVLHGKDSPVEGFEELLIEAFRLSGRRVKFFFDEHETELPGHPQAVEASLGHRLYEKQA
jgi:hypothetical protein